jgi:hypothetical protein
MQKSGAAALILAGLPAGLHQPLHCFKSPSLPPQPRPLAINASMYVAEGLMYH